VRVTPFQFLNVMAVLVLCLLMTRGISISPNVSKLLEMALLDRFSDYFSTSDHQFCFKQRASCRHAIYWVRNIIESFINNGSTVNVCALSLSKAFDRMNH